MKKYVLLGITALFMLAFMGCQTEEPEQDDKGFTLTVTGLPNAAAGKIYGASLLDDDGESVAVGMYASGMFSFYHPKADGDIPIDFDKPFNKPGVYGLGLAVADLKTFEYGDVYIYTGGTPPGKVSYTTTNKNVTLAWDDFTKQTTP